MADLVAQLVDSLSSSRSAAALDALRADLAAMGTAHVRANYGVLMREYAQRTRPGCLDSVADALDQALHSPFRNLEDRLAVAVTATIGGHRYPEMALRDACDAILSDALLQTPTPPLAETLLAASDRNWLTFVQERRNWTRLVWTVPARMVAFDTDGRRGDIAIHFQSPVSRWLAPGFWRGLLGVFGLECATATVAEADGGYLLSVRWTTPS